MNPITYFKAVYTELKQVRWPTLKQTAQLTAIVIGISLGVGAYVGALDLLFANILTKLLS